MNSLSEKNLDWDSLVNSQEPVFWNLVFDKGRLKTFVSWFFKKYGEKKTLVLLEQLKEIGFGYATNAGISLGLEDLKIPPQKNQLLAKAEMSIQTSNFLYRQGRLTGIEKMQKFIETWHETSETLKEAVVRNFEKTDILNPVYMMAFSGARGNMSQVRQLVGMRGLMSDPQGKIIDFPIQSNFREGLTLTEYLISTYGARKGIVDTALRTATAGYLTRRLVDVAQHVIVSKFDCETQRGIFLFDMKEGSQTLYSFQNRLIGRVLAQDISINDLKHENNSSENDSSVQQKFIAFRNQEVTFELALMISKLTKKALVRSPLTCENRKLVCQLCYGWSLATSRLVSIGEAVGVIAGQSIGEPGTQLTMRTFHTGGVFSAGVTQQINASFAGFVEYAEPIAGTCVRTPHGQLAFLTKTNGTMFFKKASTSLSIESQTYKIPAFTILFARHGQSIEEHELLAQISALPVTVQTTQTIEQTIYSTLEGEVYYNELDLLEDIDERYGERISTSEDWAKVWILAGKIYKPALESTFLPFSGDFVRKTSVLNQIRWASPQFFTSESLGIGFDLPKKSTTQKFQNLRYFSISDLRSESLLLTEGNSRTDRAGELRSSRTTERSSQARVRLASLLSDPSLAKLDRRMRSFLLKTERSSERRSLYQLKEFFMISKNKFQNPISKTNKIFTKTKNLNVTPFNLREFLSSSQIKTKIFQTLMTDSLGAYQRIKQLQALIFQMPVCFQEFVPGSLAKFLKLSLKHALSEKDVKPRKIKESRIYLKKMNNIFNLKQPEKSTFLHPFVLVNYVPLIIKIKTVRNYFKLVKNSTFVNSCSILNTSLQSSTLSFLPFRSRSYLLSLKNTQKRSSMFKLMKFSPNSHVGESDYGVSLLQSNQNLSSKMIKFSKFSSLRQKTSSLDTLKLKTLVSLNEPLNNVRSIQRKTILNPIKLENLILKRPIIFLPIQQVSYSNFGYVISTGYNDERFFAFSALTKNRFKKVQNSDAWKPSQVGTWTNIVREPELRSEEHPFSFQSDLQWFPESTSFKFSGILIFKSPKLYKSLFKQILINSNLKSGKPLLTSLDLKTILKNFDLSNSQVQKKSLLKESCDVSFFNNVLFLRKDAPSKAQAKVEGLAIKLKPKVSLASVMPQNNFYKSSFKINKFNEFYPKLVDLQSFSQKRTWISSSAKVSFFFYRKASLTFKNQTLSDNPKKLNDLRQVLASLTRKQVKSIDNPFFKIQETDKGNLSFAEIEWIPQENYRLHLFTKQKTLTNLKERKIFFMTKDFLQNHKSSKLKLYLTNFQGKKKSFSFKFEGYLSLTPNSKQRLNKLNFTDWQKIQEIKDAIPTGAPDNREKLAELSQVLSRTDVVRERSSQARGSLGGQLVSSNDKYAEIQTINQQTDSTFLIDFFDNEEIVRLDKNLDSKDNGNLKNESTKIKKTMDLGLGLESKVSSALTHSLKLNFLKYLKQKVVIRSREKKHVFQRLNILYVSSQKKFLERFFTFLPLLRNKKMLRLAKLGHSSLAEQTRLRRSKAVQNSWPSQLPTNIQNQPKKESFVDLTVKPGWIYRPTNLSQIFQLNKMFIGSGKKFSDNILFEQHKVFLEILPKRLDTLSDFTYSLDSQLIINQSKCSNYFKTKSYVQNSKNRFLKNCTLRPRMLPSSLGSPTSRLGATLERSLLSKLADQRSPRACSSLRSQFSCLLIRPVYYQIFPANSKMKTRLYQNVQKQQQLNFFISFNFYKNYFLEGFNLQTNLLRTVTNFSKPDINVEERSIFPIQSNNETLLVKKSVGVSSTNLSDQANKRHSKIIFLRQNVQPSGDSRCFLRKFYQKAASEHSVVRETEAKKSLISLQSNYFSNSFFSYIPFNISLATNQTNLETISLEISFSRLSFKPEKVCSSKFNFFSNVHLNGRLIRIKKPLVLKTLKFQKVFKNYNQKMNCFNKLPFFEYSVSSTYSFLANQRLLASVFSKDETELFKNPARFDEKSFKSNCYTNSFLKLPLSKNVLLVNSQNNNFGETIGFTNFGSPFEGEILTNLTDSFSVKNLEKSVNVYLEKTLKNHYLSKKLILTKSDIFSLRFPKTDQSGSEPPFLNSNFGHHKQQPSDYIESLEEDRISVVFFEKQTTKNIFKYLLGKYSHFKQLEETSLQPLNFQNYNLSDFQTTYQHKTYKLQELTMEFLSETKKLRLGHFIQPGEKLYSKMSVLNSGQIIHLSSKVLTLRKAEFFSVSPKAILHTYNEDYLEKNLPVMTLPFETLKTGDIVQGIPKVEQYLEARTTIKGRLFLNSLPVLLQAIYKRYLGYFNMENAVRQSFLKIQQILVDGVQRVYRSQGVSIADKHLEIIVRQMTSKVRIVHGGQTGFFSGELVDLEFVEHLNLFLKVKIRYEPVVLGITRASLEVDSFLSAASFQQTTKVLTRAAIENRRDFLKGLKESLLVGNLLPAGTGYVLPIRKLN